MKTRLKGRGVSGACCEGEAVVSESAVPLSGRGFDLESGTFRWKGHELDGAVLKDKVLVMPTANGFAGGDWALYSMTKLYRSGPRAIVCSTADIFTVAGSIFGGISLVDRIAPDSLRLIRTGDRIRVDGTKGLVEILRPKEPRGEGGTATGKIVLDRGVGRRLRLTDEEERMLQGEEGEGVQKCMEFLVKFGKAFGVRRMVRVESAHIAGCGYNTTGEGALTFVEWLAGTGAKVRVPSTLNPIAVDLDRWRTVMRLPEEMFSKQARMNAAFQALGCTTSFSCTPYWSSAVPRFGAHIVWGEHNAVSYANTVCGARTNFESHMATIPAAVTGRIPEYGLHLETNRRPQAIVRVECSMRNPLDWRCLGVYVGTRLHDRIPIFVGLPKQISAREFRDLCSSLGPPWANIPMLHVEGVTPEAATLRAAFQGRIPSEVETLVVGEGELREAYELVTTGRGETVELVAVGCPQYCIDDIKIVAALVKGRKVHPAVQFWVYTDRATRAVAETMGLVAVIEEAGGEVLTDTCADAACPFERSTFGFKTLATDSTKTCGFVSRMGIGTYLGRLEDCVEAAVSAQWRM